MMDIVLRSVHHGEIMIKDTIALLKPDLHIITKEGATLRTNRFLISQGSPILRRLLNDDHMSPSVLHLPDVTALALLHLISVIKNGFTTGRGDGYSVIKAVWEVAQVLGFENVPVLIFEVERPSQPAELEDLRQNALEGSHESEMDISDYKAGEVSTDPGEVDYLIKIEFEDNREENSSNDEDRKRIESDTYCFCGLQFEDVKQFEEHSRIFHPLASSRTEKGFTMRSETGDNSGMSLGRKETDQNSFFNFQAEQKQNEHGSNDEMITNTSSLNGDDNSAMSIGREKTRQYSVFNGETLYGNSTSKKRGRKHTKELNNINNNEADDQVLSSLSPEVSINNNEADVEVHKSKSLIMTINKNEADVQVLQYRSSEVTEAIAKILKKDPDNLDASEDLPKFQCKPCKQPFSNAATVLVHAEKHGEKSKRKCTMCNFSGYRIQLLSHIRGVHTKEKLFECSVCLKKFSSSHGKKSHQWIHESQSKETQFSCVTCHQKFSSRRAKNGHEKGHASQGVD